MPTARWNGIVIAEADSCPVVEGNVYFPPDALVAEHFESSATTSFCPWKGTAHYYSVVVDGRRNDDAAWVYRDPKPEAASIAGHVAFWKGVEVERG
ncbi:MAG: DUF427 domain-containing protein [Planctomycetota bacterium]|jgi:uncharacterized protein (DUF427 family)